MNLFCLLQFPKYTFAQVEVEPEPAKGKDKRASVASLRPGSAAKPGEAVTAEEEWEEEGVLPSHLEAVQTLLTHARNRVG